MIEVLAFELYSHRAGKSIAYAQNHLPCVKTRAAAGLSYAGQPCRHYYRLNGD